MKAVLKNYRQSPRKVRLVADLIRGKKVSQAETLLRYSIKDASLPILKLLNSAIANAINQGYAKEDLKVSKISVDDGYTLKRMRPRARGSAFIIRKRTSLVSLDLGTDALADGKKVKKDTKTLEKSEKKSEKLKTKK